MAAIPQHSRHFLFTVLALVLPLLFGATTILAKTIPVSLTGKIRSVKEAIRLAQPYDTVWVASGIYHENDILIDKPLAIIGGQKAVLDAGFKKGIFSVMAQNVLIAGLTLQNVEESFTKNYAAVRVRGGGHITVRNNTILNSYYGVYLEQTDSCTVSHNYIKGNAKQESTSGNAIHLFRTNHINIASNNVLRHRDGIYLESSSNSTITGNTSQNNLRYGLHFMFSDNNSYRHNKFIRNGSGIAVMYSRDIIMTDNLFEQNWGAAAYGILLKDISDSRIERNIFRQNTTGIYAEGSTRLLLKNNEFRQNGWAVRLLGSSEDLTFEQNNFIGNTFEISTSTNYSSHNIFRANYWSSYTGYDLDKDGTGDVAHKPVKLFSYLLEDIPSSVVLLRSLFIDLLELIEKVAPVLTPENVLDNQPSTRLNTWKL